MSMRRRIEALERRVVAEPITLHFADGSTSNIASRIGGRDHAVELLRAVLSGERSRELDLLAAAVRIDEPDGRLCELAQSILLSDASGKVRRDQHC